MSSRRTPVQVPAQGEGSTALGVLTGEAPASGLVWVDPRELAVDANVRSDLRLTAGFVASVGEHLLQPPSIYRDMLGAWRVLVGHRRVVAAVEAGLDRIECRVVDAPGDEWQRIRDQLTENDHRAELSMVERGKAFEQGVLLGRSAASIAREVHRPVTEVEQALAVARSANVAAAAEGAPDLPLDVAAALAVLVEGMPSDDAEEAVTDVLEDLASDGPGRARHRVQLLADDLERGRVFAAAKEQAEAEGFLVFTSWSETSKPGVARIEHLTAQPGKGNTPGKALTAEEHANCPHRAVRLTTRPTDAEPRFAATREEYCANWKKAGHYNRHASSSSGATSGPMTEEQKQARAELVANNKAMESATVVRRAFEAELLQRKTLPADAVLVAARLIALHYDEPRADAGFEAIGARVGGYGTDRDRTIEGAIVTPRQGVGWLLGAAIGAVEHRMVKDCWREPRAAFVVLWEALASWGYTLAEVEQAAVDKVRKPKSSRGKGKAS